MNFNERRYAASLLTLGEHPLYKIGFGLFVVFGLVICSRIEYGQGITGVEVLQRETSPGGTHEYVAFRTYGPGEEYWYLAVCPTEHPIFMERQYHVLRVAYIPEIALQWLTDSELQVTLPPELADIGKREASATATIRYTTQDQ